MTKEQWEKEKADSFLSAAAFFDFYREMGGKVDNINEFISVLYSRYLVDDLPHLLSNGKIVQRSVAENKVRDYYDQKFI